MRLWINAPKMKSHSPLSFILLGSILAVILTGSGIAIALSSDMTVTVYAWDRTVQLHDPGDTVADALASAGVALAPGDRVTPGEDSAIKNGMSITVERAEPVFVTKGGETATLMTAETSVAAVLEEAGIVPGGDDIVLPAAGERVPESGLVKVVEVTYAEVADETSVPYATERREDSSIEAGLSKVYVSGKPGVSRITYNARYEDGVEVSRTEVSREDVSAPRDQVVLVGTMTEVSRGGENLRFVRAFEAVASAYCPCVKCCGPTAAGYTSMGFVAEKGIIAVDPRVIPLGSRVYVDGYGYALAGDTGSAIKGNRIDVCFSTHEEALAWGLRNVKVYIIE